MNDALDIPARLIDGSRSMTPGELFNRLQDQGIAHKTIEHAPMFTVEECKALRGVLPGAHIKNLFLRNKKGRMWLVTCLEDRSLDLEYLAGQLGAGRFSFCSAQRLMHYLGVIPGAVTPLALVNDHGGKVTMVLDKALLKHEPVNVHPLNNCQTTAMSAADLLRFLEACDHPPELIEFGDM